MNIIFLYFKNLLIRQVFQCCFFFKNLVYFYINLLLSYLIVRDINHAENLTVKGTHCPKSASQLALQMFARGSSLLRGWVLRAEGCLIICMPSTH